MKRGLAVVMTLALLLGFSTAANAALVTSPGSDVVYDDSTRKYWWKNLGSVHP